MMRFLALGLLAASECLAGLPLTALPQQPAQNHGVVGVSVAAWQSSAAYDDDGLGIAAADVDVGLNRVSVDADAVVGIGTRLALNAQIPVALATATPKNGGEPQNVVGAGDAHVGLWLKVFDGVAEGFPVELSLRSEVKLPLYQGRPTRQGRAPSDPGLPTSPPGGAPALGDGQVDVDIGALFAARLPFGGHLAWEQLYRARTGGVSDAVVGRGTFAVDLLAGHLQPRWDHAFSFSFDAADGEVVGASIIETGPSVRGLAPELVPGLGVDVGVAYLFRGRNSVGGPQLRVGALYAF